MGWHPLVQWISGHGVLLGGLAVASVITFFATLLAVPWFITLIPPDYFTRRGRARRAKRTRHPVIHWLVVAGKNLLGALFLLTGLLMLVLPGQGILTILASLMLLDFPGKHRLEQWFVSLPRVRCSIDWLRRRQGHPPLETED